MRGFSAFFRKEWLEQLRKGRIWIYGGIFFAFGILSPMLAKMIPMLYELFSDDFAELGLQIGEIRVSAMDSWIQFVGNIPTGLLVMVILFSGAYTGEYSKGTLIPLLTKGLSRRAVVLVKLLVISIMWTAGLLMCFGITFTINAVFWDNSVVDHLLFACFGWWLYGMFFLCAVSFLSALFRSMFQVLLGAGAIYVVLLILNFFPKIAKYIPNKLKESATLYTGAQGPADYAAAAIITIVVSAVFVLFAVKLTDRKQL